MNQNQPNDATEPRSVDQQQSCSPADLLPWVIAELRAKHAEAEKLMIDRDPQQKHALNEFNIFAFNNVPFLADRCEALMKANAADQQPRP